MVHKKSTCSLLFTRHGKLKLGGKLRFSLPVVLNLDGDGRCDNPGHSAKYGTYTLMGEDIGNVVTFQVVQVTKGPSNSMEKEGFTRFIELLGGKDITISRITTDRHVSSPVPWPKITQTSNTNMM